MMDQEVLPPYDEGELEDGELSSSSDDEVYTPLERPRVPSFTNTLSNQGVGASNNNASDIAASKSAPAVACSPLATCHQLQQALEEDESHFDSISNTSSSSSGEESTDACIKTMKAPPNELNSRKRKKRIRRTVMVRVPARDDGEGAAAAQEKRARFKKYNIWTAALQEEALTETMRGCDVTRSRSGGRHDRNVENYDFSLRYHRLNGENCLKRRLSTNSTDDFSDLDCQPGATKRGRQSSNRHDAVTGTKRHGILGRLGYNRPCKTRRGMGRGDRDGSSSGSISSSGSDSSYEPRHIPDIEATEGRDFVQIGQEFARKLQEQKSDLFVRIIQILGIELPLEIYKETQRIEAEGGMMIKTGRRRRTPGGVFLFLLKGSKRLTPDQQKTIFNEDRHNSAKYRKELKAKARDRKVEELKKRLSEQTQQQDLPALSARKDLFLLNSENCSVDNQNTNLSNPPPSPVGGQELCPEYKPHAINLSTEIGIGTCASAMDKPSTSASVVATASPLKLINYDDDCLDINCAEMDLF